MAVKYHFPPAYTPNGDHALLCVPVTFIPFFRRFFEGMEHESRWATRDDWYQAYQVFAEMEACMMSGCVDRIVEMQERTYRLLDAALNGTAYTVDSPATPTTLAVVSPDIPAAPGLPNGITAGLRKQLLDAQGIMPSGWPFGMGDKLATTADMVKALKAASPSEITRAKETITGLTELAQGATILGTIGQFLEDGAGVTAEGGLLLTTLVATAGQIAAAAKQETMMWRLIDTLDGGGLWAPSTNVIAELVKANETLVAKLDRLITSLDGGATPAPSGNILSDLDAINTKLV